MRAPSWLLLAVVVSLDPCVLAAPVGAAPGPPPSIIVGVSGERPDLSRLQAVVQTLLRLEGIATAWERRQVGTTAGAGVAPPDDHVGHPLPVPQVFVDLTNPMVVSLRLLPLAGAAPAARVVVAPALDEATCETIAQILRSMVLAPPEADLALPAPPRLVAGAGAPVAPNPAVIGRAARRLDLRAGFVVSAGAAALASSMGATVAGSWALSSSDVVHRLIVTLSLSRTEGVLAPAEAPGDAAIVLWSSRAGVGWERSWLDRFWLAVEASVGPDRIHLAPRSNGAPGSFVLAPPQSAVWIGARLAMRGEVALAGPLLLFVQTQADLTPGVHVDVTDGGAGRGKTYPIERRVGFGGALGVAARW